MSTLAPPDTAPQVVALCERIAADYPRFRLVAKEDSGFMRLLFEASGMRAWNPGFLRTVTTTIGSAVYMPAAVRRDGVGGVLVLRHERVHLEQFRRHPVWFPVSYLLVAPALVTMRARWEMEGYVESMRAELDLTGAVRDETVEWIARQFTGPAYLFMDVRGRRVRRRLHAERARLLAEAA